MEILPPLSPSEVCRFWIEPNSGGAEPSGSSKLEHSLTTHEADALGEVVTALEPSGERAELRPPPASVAPQLLSSECPWCQVLGSQIAAS